MGFVRTDELHPNGLSMKPQTIAEVFLLAENRLLREALIRILAKKSDMRIVGAAPYSAAVLDSLPAYRSVFATNWVLHTQPLQVLR